MNILAIESSCDETAAAVVRDGRTVLSNCIASQIEMHTIYGGVVPEIASRKHVPEKKHSRGRRSRARPPHTAGRSPLDSPLPPVLDYGRRRGI